MIDILKMWTIGVGDLCFGWLLWMPRGVAIALIAVLTAALSHAIRSLSEQRGWAARCQRDLIQLRRLIRQADAAGDRNALARHRDNRARVLSARGWHESRILLTTLVPLLTMVIWAEERLSRLPILPHQTVTFRVTTPLSEVGRLTHLVPTERLAVHAGYVRRIEAMTAGEVHVGVADWGVSVESSEPIEVLVRSGAKTLSHPLTASPSQSTSVSDHGGGYTTSVVGKPYSPWNLPWLGGGWLTLYLPYTAFAYVLIWFFFRRSGGRRTSE